MKKEIKRKLVLDIIKRGESDFNFPVILVETSSKRQHPCITYRKLNAITKFEYFQLLIIEVREEKVSSAKYITVLDLTKGY